MPRPANSDGIDKFRRYRAHRRARGLRLLRVWIPDPHAPGFREEAERQARLLRGAAEEREALDFIAAAAERGDAGP
jgi:Antitoxin MazE-like